MSLKSRGITSTAKKGAVSLTLRFFYRKHWDCIYTLRVLTQQPNKVHTLFGC